MTDYVIEAIQRKYASEVWDAIASQEPCSMTYAPHEVTLALTAQAKVLHDKVGGNIVCEVRVKGGQKGSLNGSFVYSLERLELEKDIAALAFHMCDRLKHEFANTLADILEREHGRVQS